MEERRSSRKQWTIRRRMAVVAYVCGLFLFPLFYVLYPKIEGLALPYYGLITFVLTAYYGLSTYQDTKK